VVYLTNGTRTSAGPGPGIKHLHAEQDGIVGPASRRPPIGGAAERSAWFPRYASVTCDNET
jgi:hypothetical protein